MAYRFHSAKDREAVAFISAIFSYGNVKLIQNSLGRIFSNFENKFVDELKTLSEVNLRKRISSIYYRFYTETDIYYLLLYLKKIYSENESLEKYYLQVLSDEEHISETIFKDWNSFLSTHYFSNGLKFMIANPKLGSANKRLNMFLRWVVRKDNIDLGMWSIIKPENLLFPLDTHTSRICYYLGLCETEKADSKNVIEVTKSLLKINPSDPVKYDFAISRLGILNECPRKKNAEKCFKCKLFAVCQR